MNLFNEVEWNKFRAEHPELRFFQALRAFLYVDKIVVMYAEDQDVTYEDTFYWQDEKNLGITKKP